MRGLCPSVRQSLKCSRTNIALTNVCHDPITEKSFNTNERVMLPYKHIQSNHWSYLILQCERNLITSNDNYASKTIIDLEICLYVKYTRWNMPIMSHAPMWKMMSDLLQGMAMTQNPSSAEKSMPRCNTSNKKGCISNKLSDVAMP